MNVLSEKFISRASACIALGGQAAAVEEDGELIAGERLVGEDVVVKIGRATGSRSESGSDWELGVGLSLRLLEPELAADGEADVVRAFLLHPDVPRVVVGQLDDQHALVFGQRRRNLLDQLLLALDVDRREQLVLVDRLEQLLVFVLALIFGVGKRRHVAERAIELQLRGAAIGQLDEFVGGRHHPDLTIFLYSQSVRP